jgi:hypothetical protein
LTGTNFRLPYPLPNVNGPYPDPNQTVRVTINGVVSDDVAVRSATSLECLTPPGNPGTATITIQNLDVNGNPISGEAVTVAGLVTFSRADLSKKSDFTRVTETLIVLLRQQVIENVVKTVETDYSSDPGVSVFDIPEIASLPCVVVSGPKTKEPLYPYVATDEIDTGTAYKKRRWTDTVDLIYSVQGFTDHETQCLNLQALMTQVMVINFSLFVQRDPADASKGTMEYELEGGLWQSASTPSKSNVHMFTGEITVRGFQFEDIIGFPDQMVRETGAQVDTINVSDTALPLA